MKDFTTLTELITFQAAKFNNPQALVFCGNAISNQDFLNKSFYFACALKELGFKKNQTFAIIANSTPNWLIADFGALLAGAITVPIFNNISDENLLFEIKDAAIEFIFTDNLESEQQDLAVKKIINPQQLQELILQGEQLAKENKYSLADFVAQTKPHDLATIIYTSGSTGTPKGVELTHNNLVSQIKATAQVFELDSNRDKALSFLPLAHIFERMVMMFYITQGISIHFVDDIKNLGNNLREVQPTLMTSVPRMLEKVFAKIKEGVNCKKGLSKIIAKCAINRALNQDISRRGLLDKIYNKLVYKKFQTAMGGKMRMIICGGAALSQDMERFYSNIGIDIFCGYGLTETSPVLAVNHAKAHKFGTIGQAFPQVELKISSEGELLARGPNIMQGYHNDPKKTAEVIVDGWFKTGDLATIDDEGFVKIIGRKKELFKTTNGKYVAPVPIEQKLVQEMGFLIGAIIIAEGRKFTSCLLFPDFEILQNFKTKLNCAQLSDENFLTSKNLQAFVFNKIARININLDHWQQIQKFYIATKPISIESGDITPSMKLKRNILEEKYKNIIDSFYEEK